MTKDQKRARKWYKKNRAKVLKRSRAWALANPEKKLAASRRWRQRHPELARMRSQASNWKRYGIKLSIEQYRAMAKEQKDKCAICNARSKKSVLAVDHNHKTTKVRGLLCHKCNTALGQYERHQLAFLSYLAKWR